MTDPILAHPEDTTEEAFRVWVEKTYADVRLDEAFPPGTVYVPSDQPDPFKRFGVIIGADE